MPVKYLYQDVKAHIDKEDKLISTEYQNSTHLLDVQCHLCHEVYKQSYFRYRRGHRHQSCKQRNHTFPRKNQNPEDYLKNSIRLCLMCGKEYNPRRTVQILCSNLCNKLYQVKDEEQRKKTIEYCRKGGISSAKSQQRRSKAEIYFADLCIQHFGSNDVLCNELFFKDKNGNFWDSDVIIPSLRIAILYNGIWHYKQVRKDHNLKQVQARDRIKEKVIINNGYTYYIVKDMGGFNEKFISREFFLFLHKLSFKICLDEILQNK